MLETYHIYDYKSLGVRYVGILARGLDETSRIYKKVTNTYYSQEQLLLAMIADDFNAFLHSMSKKGSKKPKSIVALLTGKDKTNLKKDDREITFNSAQDFESERARLLAEIRGDDNGG